MAALSNPSRPSALSTPSSIKPAVAHTYRLNAVATRYRFCETWPMSINANRYARKPYFAVSLPIAAVRIKATDAAANSI